MCVCSAACHKAAPEVRGCSLDTMCQVSNLSPAPPNLVQTSGEAIVHPPSPFTRFLGPQRRLQGISQVGGFRVHSNLRS